MRIKAMITLPLGNANNLNRHIRSVARKEMQIAIRYFMDAMLSKIPARTGFLSGSFVRVARKYGVIYSVSPTFSGIERYYRGGLKVIKTPTSGISQVGDPEKTFIEKSPTNYVFNLVNAIRYWKINDEGMWGPWGSVAAGEAAFRAYFDTIGERFPKLTDQIKTIKFTVK